MSAPARATLGAAVEAAGALPGDFAGVFLEAARGAFVQGLQVASIVSALTLAVLAIVAATLARDGTRPGRGQATEQLPVMRIERSLASGASSRS